MTTLIIVLVIIAVVIAVAAFLVQRKNREANAARADQLRAQAATQAQATIAPAQERAAAAEAEAEQARAVAAKAEAEAEEARLAAQQIEATHEGQVRAADRVDPRVDHKADDYAPQVAGTADHTPTPPSEVNAEPTVTAAETSVTESGCSRSRRAPRTAGPPCSHAAPRAPTRCPASRSSRPTAAAAGSPRTATSPDRGPP